MASGWMRQRRFWSLLDKAYAKAFALGSTTPTEKLASWRDMRYGHAP